MPSAAFEETMVSLLRRWYSVSHSIDQLLVEALGRLGLTESSGGAVWALDPDAPAPTVRELARRLNCDPSNASLVSAKLEGGGLVERRPHPTDGRARVLHLTKRGRELRARLLADIAATTPLRRLDPTQQRQLLELLQATEALL